MTDYSTTCPMDFLAEMVEGGAFPKELLDKLKEAQEEEDEDSRDLINDLEEDRDKWEAVAGISEDIIKKLQEENKKLKEDFSVESTCLQIVKDENEVNKKNMIKFMEEKRKLDTVCETLVKEAEKNKLDIKSYQFYLFVADPKCRCAPGKEEVDEFTDDQKLREYLYEEIGYESESEEEEEEETKYDADDWTQCYGFTTKDGEYRMNMAGGGSHWEDYVITRDRNFIHNKCGESIVSTFISCPESTYVKVVHIGEDYKLEEGETDMYEMVQECFQEEIMEYQEEEKEDYKSFGVMFVEKEDEDEDDIDFFDTKKQAINCVKDIISRNKTTPHPYPEGKLIVFVSATYNPEYDNQGTVSIVKEYSLP